MAFPLRAHSSVILIALVLLSRPSVLQGQSPGDPVITDPVAVDTVYPPRTVELSFQSHGSRMNGFFYLAQGRTPHRTVILLHGFPGNERNLDLAQALRRAGMNVLYFDYRGSWGSGGTFSFGNALQDVASAVQYVRADSSVAAFRVDPGRLIIIGHSMGGWLALMHAATDSTISCTAALDFWNVGADGDRMKRDATFDSTGRAEVEQVTAPGAPIEAESGPGLAAEMKAHADEWNPERLAAQLRPASLLVISATSNAAHQSLIATLRSVHAPHLTSFQWATDHGFSDRRIRLAQKVIRWIRTHCK